MPYLAAVDWGCIFIYICVLPDECLLKSVVIRFDFKFLVRSHGEYSNSLDLWKHRANLHYCNAFDPYACSDLHQCERVQLSERGCMGRIFR